MRGVGRHGAFFRERFQSGTWYATGKTCFGMCEKNSGARYGGPTVAETVEQERTIVVEPVGEESVLRPGSIARTFGPSTPSRHVTRSRISFGSRWNVPTSHGITVGDRTVAEDAPWSAERTRSTGEPSRRAASRRLAVRAAVRRAARRKPVGEIATGGGKAIRHAIMDVALESVRMAEFDQQFAA